jgi:hypothetical protein
MTTPCDPSLTFSNIRTLQAYEAAAAQNPVLAVCVKKEGRSYFVLRPDLKLLNPASWLARLVFAVRNIFGNLTTDDAAVDKAMQETNKQAETKDYLKYVGTYPQVHEQQQAIDRTEEITRSFEESAQTLKNQIQGIQKVLRNTLGVSVTIDPQASQKDIENQMTQALAPVKAAQGKLQDATQAHADQVGAIAKSLADNLGIPVTLDPQASQKDIENQLKQAFAALKKQQEDNAEALKQHAQDDDKHFQALMNMLPSYFSPPQIPPNASAAKKIEIATRAVVDEYARVCKDLSEARNLIDDLEKTPGTTPEQKKAVAQFRSHAGERNARRNLDNDLTAAAAAAKIS